MDGVGLTESSSGAADPGSTRTQSGAGLKLSAFEERVRPNAEPGGAERSERSQHALIKHAFVFRNEELASRLGFAFRSTEKKKEKKAVI